MDWKKLLGLDSNSGGIADAMEKVVGEVESEYDKNPPTIAVIGLSGVGKSSTINSMFGTTLPTSPTTRGTTEFESVRARLKIQRGKGVGGIGYLRVYDAPGLGEDTRRDPDYLRMYEEHLPNCDVALWLIAARNRALALDQQYIDRLRPLINGKIIFGINQVDLVDPNDWNTATNMPSKVQRDHIENIVGDRSERLSSALGTRIECIDFSASKYYRLMELYEHIIDGAPKSRRWLFEFVRTFDASDWLNRASGLSESQKSEILSRYGS